MPEIITLTWNPALDKSTSVESLIPEKKLRCRPPHFQPGGGGVNVARAIHKLGGKATAIYPAGGHTGLFFNQLLNEEQVDCIPIQTSSYTRENLVVLDESSGKQYRFGMPGSGLKESEWKACLEKLEALSFTYLVVSGSLPAGVPARVLSEIASLCNKRSAKLIVDTSGDALREAAKTGVYLLKPNLGELASLCGTEMINTEDIVPLCRKLIVQEAAEIIVVSMGKGGAMLVTAGDSFTAIPPAVEVKSTVGAGDSMVAGLTLSLQQGKTLQEALTFAVCCGTAATLNPGTELCHAEDVEDLLKRMKSR